MRKKSLRKVCLILFSAFLFHSSFAQTRTIRGMVSDPNGNPLQNATVSAGVGRGAGTDVNGGFTLTVPQNAKTISVSFVGMKSKTVSIEGKTDIVISLSLADSRMDEVVVIGYGTSKRADINSSIASISEKDIKDLKVAGLDQMLQGKVPGVSVSSNTGQPGGGVSVRIRGITTITGSNDPLYVIDGVQVQAGTSSIQQNQLGGVSGQNVQSPLATLNPEDIASVDILKDATAQAIYGSAAASGVILITTKHSRTGEGKLNYDPYFGQAELYRRLPIMNLRQYATYFNSVQQEQGAAIGLDTIGEFMHPNLLGPGTDWQSAVFQKGFTQNHQLSFSGGSNKTTYYMSGNYFTQTGTLIGSDFTRYAFRASVDQQVKPWLKAGISSNMSATNQRITVTDGQQSVIPLILYNSPATPISLPDGSFATTQAVAGNNFGNATNPVALASLRDTRARQYKDFGNLYADILILKNLDFRTQFNFDVQLQANSAFQPAITNTLGQSILGPSILQEGRYLNLYTALQNYATYTPSFGKHQLNITLGHEEYLSTYNNTTTTANSLINNIQSLGAGTIVAASSNGNKGTGSGESYFARVTYTYDNRYSISASERRDGSSNFAPGKRIGYFPATAVGWTISNEDFMKDMTFVNYLKLRVGAGLVGNNNTGGAQVYSTNIRLATNASGLFNNPAIPGPPANVFAPNLQWEAVNTYNAGIDATILNKRIDLTLDVYKKVTTKMILPTVLPGFSGLDPNPPSGAYNQIEPPPTNAGQMTNTGVDIGITTHNVVTKDFEWRTNLEFSVYKNKLDRLTVPDEKFYGRSQDFNPSILTVTAPGQSVGQFYGFVTDGLYRTMNDLNNATTFTTAPVGLKGTWLGDYRYKDLNKDKVIDANDETYIGDPNPKFTYGMTNTFNYKTLSLSIFLSGVYGDKIFNYSRMQDESLYSAYNNQLSTVLDRYTATNINGKLPRYNQYNSDNLVISDRYVEDGSYLRIQNVTLGYNLPARIANKAKMSSARVYLSVQNLYTFTKYSGYDPEIGAFNGGIQAMNIDYGHYPVPRTYTIGANLEF